MDNPLVIALLIVVGLIVLKLVVVFALAGGEVRRIRLVVRASLRLLCDPALVDKVRPLLDPPKPEGVMPSKPSGEPVRFLALLQREGRLVDFLLEEIQAYSDDQVGAAVRDIHRHCKEALQEHLVMEPVLKHEEGSTVEIPVGFDPSAIRLTGNVTGQPPFRGTLKHHGWRVLSIKLAPPPAGQDELVLMPAEVELP